MTEAEGLEPSKVSIEQLKKEAIKACSEEINAVLARHGCSLDASMVLRAGEQPKLIIEVIVR